MKLIQDINGGWHNTAIIKTISVQPKSLENHGCRLYAVVIDEINNDGVGHTIEVSLTEGEEGRRDALGMLDEIVTWLCYGEEHRRSETYPLMEKERRDKAAKEAAIRDRQKSLVSGYEPER